MTYLLSRDDDFVDLPTIIAAPDGTTYPRSIVDTSDAAFLATIGVYELVPAVIPTGKVAASIKRALKNGKVVETAVLEDAPPPPLEPLRPISDRQFFQALASPPFSLITQPEALDAVKTGEIPDIMKQVVAALPPEQEFPVAMILSGGIEFHRDNDLVELFGASQNMTPEQIDGFWRFAQSL